MKAIVVHAFGAPEVMRLEEVPDPAPGPGEVVLRVCAAGVNPVDTYRRSGQYASLPALPYTPGSDAAGEVVAVGAGISGWKHGDRAYTNHSATSAYATLLRCRSDQLHRLPASVQFSRGAALGVPYATAHRALFQKGDGRASERLLVHGGTGGVGLAAIQLARAAGLHVTATGSSPEGRNEALRQGAHEVLDHSASDHAERLKNAAGDNGFDLVLEMLANRNLAVDLRILAKRGRVILIGSRGPTEIDPRDGMLREAEIRGMTLFNTPPDELAEIHASLYAGLENGTLRPVVGLELPLAEAPIAHERVMEAGHRGKIILVP